MTLASCNVGIAHILAPARAVVRHFRLTNEVVACLLLMLSEMGERLSLNIFCAFQYFQCNHVRYTCYTSRGRFENPCNVFHLFDALWRCNWGTEFLGRWEADVSAFDILSSMPITVSSGKISAKSGFVPAAVLEEEEA